MSYKHLRGCGQYKINAKSEEIFSTHIMLFLPKHNFAKWFWRTLYLSNLSDSILSTVPNERDNIGKAKEFAEYTKQNPISGRLQLIRQKQLLRQDVFIRLDMSKRAICDKVCKATNNSELDNIFEEHGQSDLWNFMVKFRRMNYAGDY